MRFLEAQNRKLAADLDLLRGRWGKDTLSVRAMYEGELQVRRAKISNFDAYTNINLWIIFALFIGCCSELTYFKNYLQTKGVLCLWLFRSD